MSKYRTRQEWQNILEQQKKSELSVARFCREKKIHSNSFYNFRKREAERKRNLQNDNQLVEIQKPHQPVTPPKALIRIGLIEIVPGHQPDQDTMSLLFKSALEATNAVL